MDPKTPANLDPKLKEVYDRVMGTANPASSPPPQTTSQTPVMPSPPMPPVQPTVTTPLSNSPFSSSAPTKPLGSSAPSPAGLPPLPNTKPLGSNLPGTPPPSHHEATDNVAAPLSKPVVDYAALAAKFATPTPTINAVNASSRPAAVMPSTTTYGMVDNKPAKDDKKDKMKEPKAAGSSSPMKKILLIAGIPLLLIGYTVVWVFVFHVDIMSFLPLPK